jgi:hypothetical protein
MNSNGIHELVIVSDVMMDAVNIKDINVNFVKAGEMCDLLDNC